jgi:AAA family ATP:ADP antiporter
MGLAALVSVTVPLALVWGVLGIWLGRAQHRRVTRDAAPARVAPREEAVAL